MFLQQTELIMFLHVIILTFFCAAIYRSPDKGTVGTFTFISHCRGYECWIVQFIMFREVSCQTWAINLVIGGWLFIFCKTKKIQNTLVWHTRTFRVAGCAIYVHCNLLMLGRNIILTQVHKTLYYCFAICLTVY